MKKLIVALPPDNLYLNFSNMYLYSLYHTIIHLLILPLKVFQLFNVYLLSHLIVGSLEIEASVLNFIYIYFNANKMLCVQ